MSYEYKGKTYELRAYTLKTQAAAGELLKEISRLSYELYSSIDMSYANSFEKRKAALQRRIEQCEAGGKDATQTKEELESLLDEMQTDKQLQALNKLVEEQSKYIVFDLIGNEKLMKDTFRVILNEPVELDYEDSETVDFVNNVIHDFFFLKDSSNKKLQV
ncbi:MAG: hypothetical protein IPG99_20005 [Ignavibacteria bacterium]|nr:hypothetical protein [Ignavibacteria bacterium]